METKETPPPVLKPQLSKKQLAKAQRRKDLPIDEHELTPADCCKKHEVDMQAGLTGSQVAANRLKHGWNRLTPPKSTPGWLLYLLQYANFFSILLVAGGLLCFIAYGIDGSDVSNLYLGIILEVVVFITSTFSYVQEAKSNAIMLGFKNMVPKKCKVVRDGATAILDAADLVPGDIVEYQEGDAVPADLRALESHNLKVDNSALTGESEAQERNADTVVPGDSHKAASGKAPEPGVGWTPAIEAGNMLWFSTIVTSGHGKGLVIGTGDNTMMGQIAGLVSDSGDGDTKPPLIQDIDRFIRWVSAAAITLGIAFLGTGLGLGVQTVVQSLVYCISVIVATVPEGLLATLTVALALTAKRMHTKSMLVKFLQGVETLGCTTVIASDKTGTLTQNRMTVQHCWYDNTLFDIPAPRNEVQRVQMMADKEAKGFQGWFKLDPTNPTFVMLHKVAAICSNSDFMLSTNALDPAAPMLDMAVEWQKSDFDLLGLQCTGDASESGLLKMVQFVRDAKEYRTKLPKLFEIKFNSTNKWQLSVHTDLEAPAGSPPLMVLKGAPEKVWERCTHIISNGEVHPLTPEWEAKFTEAYEKLGSLGERVLGFAYRQLDGMAHDYPYDDQPTPNFPTDGLTFAGLISLMDPPREGVLEAVATCKRAHVRVYMVTGDHPITATAIAREIGILDMHMEKSGRGIVISGDNLRDVMEIEDEVARTAEWDRILSHEQIVFARVTPAHKLLIVENNQRLGQIVAVTGDGVNDAPALKRANIGISMGISGKDVSKEAADMILMDDNFASIVNGIEEGRLIFDNLKKSIMYTLTSKPPELIPFLLWVAARLPLSLSTILILAVDIGTDMLPAIGLAYEHRESAIMLRPPRSAQKDPLVDFPLLLYTYIHIGVIQCIAAYYGFFVALNDYGYPPRILLGLGLGWPLHPLICTNGGAGDAAITSCGFGCDSSSNLGAQLQSLNPALNINANYCSQGCFQPPTSALQDPFSEMTSLGFRGFAAGAVAVCARTCEWYNSLGPLKDTYVAASADPASDFRLILTPGDVTLFDTYCNGNAVVHEHSNLYGFPGRGTADPDAFAETGAMHYWDGSFQSAPDLERQRYILQACQCVYFVTVVLCKGITALTSKTRRLSIFQHGIRRNRFLLYGILCQLILAVIIAYAPPLNIVFMTQPMAGQHWALFIPFFIFIFCYDETRKFIIRSFDATHVIARALYW
eukprot:CAMPEP_0119101430 /NCGR_PEP_ID=MMETSP1180-20130426/476_1 /TAXON_ID=3052 ORGANISM="Chlamydomonas cf sp, Strain CCMP681" /NCGR_SAMPLE_ID=MMETSP1180 /ASSEMBLY_ACC=CAM_ASM_000741 /LENGTH=1208 /DNA_ID=CAMNT_0007085549 /DNA_START=49 /DNA_END=3675 /DNA_ORIENTATION=+